MRRDLMSVRTGDVVEIDFATGPATALVLLSVPEAVILDLLDGTTPIVVDPGFLAGVRVFDGEAVDSLAA
jgi:hypothetical protein